MISNNILVQYIYLKDEIKENREEIDKLEQDIEKLIKRIGEIEAGEIVKDKVYGGNGGQQGFVVSGIPMKEYREKKNLLYSKKIKLEERKIILEKHEIKILGQVNEVEAFIKGIDDCLVRRIVHYRIIEGISWSKVADKIGGESTEDSVKKIYQRYLKKICPICPV